MECFVALPFLTHNTNLQEFVNFFWILNPEITKNLQVDQV